MLPKTTTQKNNENEETSSEPVRQAVIEKLREPGNSAIYAGSFRDHDPRFIFTMMYPWS